MKRVFLTALLLCFSLYAKPQVLISLLFGDKLNSPNLEFGLNTGLSFSKIDGLETDNRLGGFNLGLYFDIRAKNNLWIHTGILLKSAQGMRKLTDRDLLTLDAMDYTFEGDYSQRLECWYVPVLAKYRFENNIYAELGPQVGLIRKGFVLFEGEEGDFTTKIAEENLDDMNRIDVGVTVGAGFKFFKGTGLAVGARYYQGFIDVYDNISGTTLNNFYIYTNIPIGVKKAKAKAENQE
jgi:hypothetical protein